MADNCPFCDRKQFEERLIAKSEGFYLIATLGQITNGGYILVFPKKHIVCGADITSDSICSTDQELMCGAVEALKQEYERESSSLFPITSFEHGIVGQIIKHAHTHVLPTVIDLTPRIRADFTDSEIQELEYPGHMQELYRQRQEPYLFWSVANKSATVCWNPPAPPQYLRIIAAEALGRPERANWRTMDPELDKRLWSETVRRLKVYFS